MGHEVTGRRRHWDTNEYTEVAGSRMHAAVLGFPNAPDVVCVPGPAWSHRYFLPLARQLAPTVRVSAVDLPGFGRSSGPGRPMDVRELSVALAEWLWATERGGSVLVAHSGGCQVVADLAMHSAALLGPVVLTGPTPDPRARTSLRHLARLSRSGWLERPGLGLIFARDLLDCGPLRFLRTVGHLVGDSVERKLPYVHTPAVVVRGERDPVVPHSWAAQAADTLPLGRLVEVPGAGHAVHHAFPEELAALVRTLLPVPTPTSAGRGPGVDR
jgi:pimeloyl-ACP methyl ester carboxylesterase